MSRYHDSMSNVDIMGSSGRRRPLSASAGNQVSRKTRMSKSPLPMVSLVPRSCCSSSRNASFILKVVSVWSFSPMTMMLTSLSSGSPLNMRWYFGGVQKKGRGDWDWLVCHKSVEAHMRGEGYLPDNGIFVRLHGVPAPFLQAVAAGDHKRRRLRGGAPGPCRCCESHEAMSMSAFAAHDLEGGGRAASSANTGRARVCLALVAPSCEGHALSSPRLRLRPGFRLGCSLAVTSALRLR
mmetsp:Transcript_27696/g.87851  ORF Transcript_27696/g.87851 Transcript_27696/m.87851 type:complete len:238 (-) Transcript_27696:123-836(-)